MLTSSDRHEVSCRIHDRNQLVRLLADPTPSALGLEVGPNTRGVCPKRDGWNCRIADYASAEELRRLHEGNDAVDPSLIESVDYVLGNLPLGEAIAEKEAFDYIIASHVIEHIPDLIQFLKDCESLLRDQGVLCLVVPDKRYIFDALRPLTSLGQVIESHLQRGRRHRPSAIIDYWAYVVSRDGAILWNPDTAAPITPIHTMQTVQAKLQEYLASEDYVDTHGWVFTPSSFRLLISDLGELGETVLREVSFADHPSYPNEFVVCLSRQGQGPGLSRTELSRGILEECRAIL